MSVDIVSVLEAKWVAALCTKGKIEYDTLIPPTMVGYGVIFRYTEAGYIPDTINAPYGADHYLCYIIGRTTAELNNLIGHLIYLFDDTTGSVYTSNTSYSRFYIDSENVKILDKYDDTHPCTTNWRVALTNVWCVKKYHDKNRLFVQPTVREFGGKTA
jgi:hypothetical protein